MIDMQLDEGEHSLLLRTLDAHVHALQTEVRIEPRRRGHVGIELDLLVLVLGKVRLADPVEV